MIKAVSFSLFGDIPKYNKGMIKNVELVKKFYPDWECMIYCDKSVPASSIYDLTYAGAFLVDANNIDLPGMMWRFLPVVDVFIVRDCDSRITKREVDAVDEWLDSGKTLHIMRDHPHHKYNILGGMWGMRRVEEFNMKDEIEKYLTEGNHKVNTFSRVVDMSFVSDVLYERFKDDSFIHASYHAREKHAKPFPSPLEDKRFVGEIYNENDERDYQYTKL